MGNGMFHRRTGRSMDLRLYEGVVTKIRAYLCPRACLLWFRAAQFLSTLNAVHVETQVDPLTPKLNGADIPDGGRPLQLPWSCFHESSCSAAVSRGPRAAHVSVRVCHPLGNKCSSCLQPNVPIHLLILLSHVGPNELSIRDATMVNALLGPSGAPKGPRTSSSPFLFCCLRFGG